MNENKQRDDRFKKQQQPQQGNPQRPQDLESQGEQKGAQQIPSSQPGNVTRKT
ncbi:MAG TPA: hypothetical protein VHB97_24385 [Polyangia bacterium]|jgi:hypothetical protein|nr:hypothetical protein [Polyangia bacterium]